MNNEIKRWVDEQRKINERFNAATQPQPTDLCVCGHVKKVHWGRHATCLSAACPCESFRPAQQPACTCKGYCDSISGSFIVTARSAGCPVHDPKPTGLESTGGAKVLKPVPYSTVDGHDSKTLTEGVADLVGDILARQASELAAAQAEIERLRAERDELRALPWDYERKWTVSDANVVRKFAGLPLLPTDIPAAPQEPT